jgi:hypothetical protein
VLIGKAARAKRALRSVLADDTLSTSTPNPERPMPEVKTGEAVQLLDLMVEYFEDDAPWIRGQFYDGHGRRCLVGAIHYLSRKTPPLAGWSGPFP